jgi:anaerobic selenocysteine-containing dehydrogenase
MATGTSESKVTTDHEEIRRWVEDRGGHPAQVKGTEKGESAGLLRIDYPGFSGEGRLEEITWDEFFEAFEKNKLAFLYQEETKDGKQSRFSKLVDRDKAEEE